MSQDTGDEDTIARANKRLHAARRALGTAYDRRDVLAEEIHAKQSITNQRTKTPCASRATSTLN
jgi:hypothetical protein